MKNLTGLYKRKVFATLIIVGCLILFAWYQPGPASTITWKFTNLKRIGNHTPELLDKPVVVSDAVAFDGIDDGLVFDTIPIAGWSKFTIEVFFKPDAGGPVAPRFIHFEDTAANRGTFELRLTPDGRWYMDTFLKNGRTNKGLTLIDSTILHPAGEWYWAAMVYDGTYMTSYVNGHKELQDTFLFPPMTKGRLSAGVRLNKVNWYKGLIKEIRFHPAALDSLALQRI